MTDNRLQTNLTLKDFNYFLPENLIAQHPAIERTHSRLLRLDSNAKIHDHHFNELLNFLRPHDLLVFNDTRVIKARLHGQKETGGQIEVLIERILENTKALAHIKASNAPKVGTALFFAEKQVKAKVIDRKDGLFILSFEDELLTILDQHGKLPLPPYITHDAKQDDEERYQTVYAKHPGAVAAPTAGLHFTDALFEQLKNKKIDTCYVTLHVGAGTFQPVRVEKIKDHHMHSERYTVSQEVVDKIITARKNKGRIIAIGTTSVRALESAAQQGGTIEGFRAPIAHQDDTCLFITPGYEFKVIDGLVTNFHLPESTLLMLVSALTGLDTLWDIYNHAIDKKYRFFSYGDAMFIEPKI